MEDKKNTETNTNDNRNTNTNTTRNNTNNNVRNNTNVISNHNNNRTPIANVSAPTIVEHQGGSWLCCVPCYWLRSNNSVHKASLTVATLLVTSLLVASPVLFLISAVPASDTPPRDCRFLTDDGCLYTDGHSAAAAAMLGPECTEPDCLAASARVVASLDRKADPCSDFKKYSCGRWKAEGGGHSLTDMQAGVDLHLQQILVNSSGSFRKLGDFYRSCTKVSEKKINVEPSKCIFFCSFLKLY